MNQKLVKINTEKFASMKTQFASNLAKLSGGITTLTAMDGGVTPEQVSQVLQSEVLPSLDGVKEIISQIDEALPTSEDGIEGAEEEQGGNISNPDNSPTGVLNAGNSDKPELDEDGNPIRTGNTNENPKNTDAADAALQKRLQHMEAKLTEVTQQSASILSENISMKKANLSKKYASQFPTHMRSAMEDEFLKENEEEPLEAMEAKLASVSTVINAYKTAGLIKKASFPSSSGIIQTAKNDKPKNGESGLEIPFYMR